VVVLDQHRVEKPAPVVAAPADANRVLLQVAPPGRCLAGVVDVRARAGHCVHAPARQRGHATEALKEVQRDAFGGQDGPRGARPSGQHSPRLDAPALGRLDGRLDRPVVGPGNLAQQRPAAEDQLLSRDEPTAHPCPRRYERAGHVAGAEVLLAGQHQQAPKVFQFNLAGFNRHRGLLASKPTEIPLSRKAPSRRIGPVSAGFRFAPTCPAMWVGGMVQALFA